MATIVLVIHLFLALGIVGLVLMQRSEGGALGIGGGGGGGMGGLFGNRAAANFLTRATGILAGLFFVTSLVLAILADTGPSRSILEGVPAADSGAPADASAGADAAPAGPSVPLGE